MALLPNHSKRLLFGAALLADDTSPVMASTHACVAASAFFKNRLPVCAALLAVCLLPVMASTHAKASASQTLTTFKAQAFHIETGALIYSETHEYVNRDGTPVKASVEYSDAQGAKLAIKQLNFNDSVIAPHFDRTNLQSGYREAFVDKGEQHGVLIAAMGTDASCEKPFSLNPALVVDAGFNQFLKSHLVPLARGERLNFDLALAKACRTIEFRAQAKSITETQIWINMQPASGLLRMVVPDTLVLYDRQTGDIMEYRGLSDLNDNEGRNMRVRIVFEEPVHQPLTAELAAQ